MEVLSSCWKEKGKLFERQKDKRKLVSGKGASNERLQCGRQLGQRRLSSARKAKVTPFSEKQIDLC